MGQGAYLSTGLAVRIVAREVGHVIVVVAVVVIVVGMRVVVLGRVANKPQTGFVIAAMGAQPLGLQQTAVWFFNVRSVHGRTRAARQRRAREAMGASWVRGERRPGSDARRTKKRQLRDSEKATVQLRGEACERTLQRRRGENATEHRTEILSLLRDRFTKWYSWVS